MTKPIIGITANVRLIQPMKTSTGPMPHLVCRRSSKSRWPSNPTTRIRSIGSQDLYLHD